MADWRVHKISCPIDGKEEAPPSPAHRRAILLPEDGDRPRSIWISTTGDTVQLQQMRDFCDETLVQTMNLKGPDNAVLPQLDGLLGEHTIRGVDVEPLITSPQDGGEHLDHSIYAAYRDEMLMDRISKKNAVLERFTDGKIERLWKGSLVLYGMTKEHDSQVCVDLSTADLGLAVKAMVRVAREQQTVIARRNQFHRSIWGQDLVEPE